jgi:hypothetical protein
MIFKDLLLKLKKRYYDNITSYPGDQPTEIPKIAKDSKYLALVFSEHYKKCENWQASNNTYHEEVVRNNDMFEKDCIDCIVNCGLSINRAAMLFDFVNCLTQEKEKMIEYLIELLGIFEKVVD